MNFCARSLSGRPMSDGSVPAGPCTAGVYRRMRNLRVEEQHRDVGAGQQACQVVAGRLVFLHLAWSWELTVVSSSLSDCISSRLVSSSSLVLCSSSLMLVDFLVGRLQLFVAGLEFLDRALQFVADAVQLLGDCVAGWPAAGAGVIGTRPRLLEADDEVIGRRLSTRSGEAVTATRLRRPASVSIHPSRTVTRCASVDAARAVRSPHRAAHALTGQCQQVARGFAARAGRGTARCSPWKIDDALLAVDRHRRGRVMVEQGRAGQLRDATAADAAGARSRRRPDRLRRATDGVRQREIQRPVPGRPDAAEDPRLLVDRLEQLFATRRRFRWSPGTASRLRAARSAAAPAPAAARRARDRSAGCGR